MATAESKPPPKFSGLVSGIYRRVSASLSRTNDKNGNSDDGDDMKSPAIITDSISNTNLNSDGENDAHESKSVPEDSSTSSADAPNFSYQNPSASIDISVGDSSESGTQLDDDQTPIASPPVKESISVSKATLNVRPFIATPVQSFIELHLLYIFIELCSFCCIVC